MAHRLLRLLARNVDARQIGDLLADDGGLAVAIVLAVDDAAGAGARLVRDREVLAGLHAGIVDAVDGRLDVLQLAVEEGALAVLDARLEQRVAEAEGAELAHSMR